jgi:hypothetical protein
MATLTVGVNQHYSTLSSAIAASHSGDTIEVAAGTYTNDFAEITDDITIVGVGGMVDLVATTAPPNGKAILVTDGNDTIENVSFSGAKVADGNGAGIRYQSGNLTLINDYFHDNQDGLLAASNQAGSITIKTSEFAHNGTGDGQTHNLYVGEVGTLTIDASLFTGAVVGHEIKSRADTTIIENSRIIDGPTGTASYSIDLPDGGKATITNNFIEQGPDSQNPAIIHYGGEGGPYAGSSLSISGNIVLNDLHSASARLLLNQTSVSGSITGNTIYGLTSSQLTTGPATEASNTFPTGSEPALDLSHPFTSGSGTGGGGDPTVVKYLGELAPGIAHPDASLFALTALTHPKQTATAGSGDAMLVGTHNGDLLVGGSGFTVLVGGAGTEHLQGGAGTNVMLGTTGNAVQIAGSGANAMQGGAGHDHFWISYATAGNATIYDFDPALDHIRIIGAPHGVNATNILHNATTAAAGDAVLHLGSHTITLDGITPTHASAGWFAVTH